MCPHLDYFVAFSSFVAGKGAKNFDFFKRFDLVFDFFKRFDLVFDFFKRFDSVFDFFKRFDLVFVYLSIK
jgi:hypothetical protein